jgi:hypothetical protein
VRAKRGENFAGEQQNQTQQRNGNRGRKAEMRRLTEAAIGFVVAAGVGVRHNLQQKEERNQGQGKGSARGQPAISPDISGPGCAASEQNDLSGAHGAEAQNSL